MLSWIAPGGLVLAAAVAAVRLAPDSAALASFARLYPYAVFGAAALLAWRFHRSRVFAAVLAVAVVETALRLIPGNDGQVAYVAAAVLLPLTLGVLAMMKDRGLLTPRGLIQLNIVLAQLLAVALLLDPRAAEVAAAFGQQPRVPGLTSWTPLPQLALPAFVCGFTLAGIAVLRRRGVVEKGFFWTLVLVLLGLHAASGVSSAVYLIAAGLVLGLSAVETGYSMAYRDELTDLPSRRALPDALAALGTQYSIAMVDVDHFKKFNDKHGHDVGDQVLRMVASRLADVSGGGRAFRYGGEEFAVLFPGTSREDAIPHLEALRGTIEETSFTVRGRGRAKVKTKNKPRKPRRGSRLAVTVSIGVAERNGRYATPEAVLKAADKALYRAKQAGRNRVVGN